MDSCVEAISQHLDWNASTRRLVRKSDDIGVSVNAALVRFTYPHRMLGRGIGINALVVAVSAAVGPTLAARILATATWPYLFAINIPFGIATVVILPAHPTTLDVVRMALSGAGFGLFQSPNNRTMIAAVPVRICIGISKWNSRLK
jgi:hypothetical protein